MATITKMGEHLYHFELQAPTRQIDEVVNDEQLLGLLAREVLLNGLGEVISAKYVMARLDAIAIGARVDVIVRDRP